MLPFKNMDYPNLSNCKAISFDIESFDPMLLDYGPQFHTKRARVVGVSIGADNGKDAWYFTDLNGHDLRFIRDVLQTPIPKVGTNIIYDLQGLRSLGIEVNGPLHDVQIAEPLLDENKTGKYSLNDLAQHYLNETKNEDILYKWLAKKFGGAPTRKQQAGRIHKAPRNIVEPYALSDATLPMRIIKKQLKLIESEGLRQVYDVEVGLIRMLLEMRWQGVRVNLSRAAQIQSNYTDEINKLMRKVEKETHVEIDSVWKAATIKKVFNKLKLSYPLTPKTKAPSFTSSFISNHKHPVVKAIHKLREYTKFRDTFIQNYILDGAYMGRIHCQFNQVLGNSSGAKSGRFSSSKPNLQNIPAKTDEGKLIRTCFIPEVNMLWGRHDYSQIEYRLMVHYATGKEADKARRMYKESPKTDFHTMVQNECNAYGLNLKRKAAKTVNFGIIYGLGEAALAFKLGMLIKESNALRKKIQEIYPYGVDLFYKAMTRAQIKGYITTVLGRKARFPFYEPSDKGIAVHPSIALTRDKDTALLGVNNFIKKHGNNFRYGVKRTYTYTALNRLLQGSAADVMKKAMLDLYESGIYEHGKIPYPHLTVHDELDHSLPKGAEGKKYAKIIKEVLENTLDFSVPIICDYESGKNWGSLKEIML